jgi:hypothetical protein
MWHYWLKMEYSSDEDTIPTWKQWAKAGDKLRYNNKYKYTIDLNTIQSLDVITEENKKKVLGTITGAGAGMLLLGPLGAVAGMLLGGNKKLVSMAIKLQDGRNFVATCTAKTHLMLLPYVKTNSVIDNDTKECPMCAETVKKKAKICRYCNHMF